MFLEIGNGEAREPGEVPLLGFGELRDGLIQAVEGGDRLAAFFGRPLPDGRVRLLAIVARERSGTLGIAAADVEGRFPALTPECPQAHAFEREIAEQWGLVPEGHPWLKPVRYHRSYAQGRDAWGRPPGEPLLPGVTDFFRAEGEEVHEVAVGPVHAGVIEPGHFRFQCHGEEVLHLEIALGYQHRGAERRLWGGPDRRTVHYMETLAGDTTVGHALAYAHLVESLSEAAAPPRAQALRGIALELERLANHAGDLGALAGDVGFLPGAAHFGRIRGDFLNLTALLCGSRFGRGLVRPGGCGFDLEPPRARELCDRLAAAAADSARAADLIFDSPSVLARFEETGPVPREACERLGLVGPAARACGVARDARFEFPSGIFRFAQIPISLAENGDVFARAFVRRLEMQRSAAFIREQIEALPEGEVRGPVGPLCPGRIAVALEEGWRGEILHAVQTDEAGRFLHYKVVDPSFRNWTGLALAMRGQAISDFPLCNKSFNLSYCGHDL